jgi:hypothetical protein
MLIIFVLCPGNIFHVLFINIHEQHTKENASLMILPLVLVLDFILEIVGYYKPVYCIAVYTENGWVQLYIQARVHCKKRFPIFPSSAGMCCFDHPNFFLFSRQTSRVT